jgi:hypothetical protein
MTISVVGEIGDPTFPLHDETALSSASGSQKRARDIAQKGKWDITDFTDVTHLPIAVVQGKRMNTKEMSMVRRVIGRRGSLSLYRSSAGSPRF